MPASASQQTRRVARSQPYLPPRAERTPVYPPRKAAATTSQPDEYDPPETISPSRGSDWKHRIDAACRIPDNLTISTPEEVERAKADLRRRQQGAQQSLEAPAATAEVQSSSNTEDPIGSFGSHTFVRLPLDMSSAERQQNLAAIRQRLDAAKTTS